MQIAARIGLKKGKERPLLQRHHWIYSGAIDHQTGEGPFAEVCSASGERLGLCLLNPDHSIAAHMIAFGNESIEEALSQRISSAVALRRAWFDPAQTNAYRLINAEGDGIPGLIVDVYDQVLVLQISHLGLESLKPLILSLLIDIVCPQTIYEKSTSFLRKKGGMEETRALLYGPLCPEIQIRENGLLFAVDILEGQKTGFFLDQREMRSCVRQIAQGKRVLNCFSYTGGFSVAALAGGALHVDSVESSTKCGQWTEKNLNLNNLTSHRFVQTDVFDFLSKELCDWNYDLVILDPPAFVKKRKDLERASRAYKEMNAHVIQNMAPNSLLLTCSCSYHVDETHFQNILFRAALEAKRSVRILGRHRLALDHPISLFHPESSYLKSFLLAIA